jgi:hypothetical protein
MLQRHFCTLFTKNNQGTSATPAHFREEVADTPEGDSILAGVSIKEPSANRHSINATPGPLLW